MEDIDRTRDRQLMRAAGCHIMVRIILIMWDEITGLAVGVDRLSKAMVNFGTGSR